MSSLTSHLQNVPQGPRKVLYERSAAPRVRHAAPARSPTHIHDASALSDRLAEVLRLPTLRLSEGAARGRRGSLRMQVFKVTCVRGDVAAFYFLITTYAATFPRWLSHLSSYHAPLTRHPCTRSLRPPSLAMPPWPPALRSRQSSAAEAQSAHPTAIVYSPSVLAHTAPIDP